jgi:hypothetical protein
MAFGLQLAKKKDFISEIVGRTSKTLGLDHMLERKTKRSLGGQHQCVALGRASMANSWATEPNNHSSSPSNWKFGFVTVRIPRDQVLSYGTLQLPEERYSRGRLCANHA